MESELLELIASLQEQIANLRIFLIVFAVLQGFGFYVVLSVLSYQNTNFKLRDRGYRLIDSLPFKYRWKLIKKRDASIKTDVQKYLHDLENGENEEA